jgi:hypothetical protein
MTQTYDRPPEPTNQGKATDSTESYQFIKATLEGAQISGSQIAVGNYIVQVGRVNGAKLEINVNKKKILVESTTA